MRKTLVTTVLTLLFVAPLVIAAPALAANELTFDADTTIDLSNPDTNLTILNNSIVDSMTVNAGSIDFVLTTGGSLTIRSTSRKTLSHNSSSLPVDSVCNDSYSQISVTPGAGVTAESIRISVSSETCTTAGGTTGGGGGGTAGVSTPTTTETTTTETITTTETTVVTQETVSEVPGVPATDDAGNVTLDQMTADAETVVSGDVDQVTAEMGVVRDLAAEVNYDETIVAEVVADTSITAEARNTITSFVTYGTKSTGVLGAGERAGVVNSFKAAFGGLPTSAASWNDVIKIANGRFPSTQSVSAEQKALASFTKIYKRLPDFTNPHDDAAIKVMAYGLRPADRNLESEKAGIRIFKDIHGYNPVSATDWDAVRAIAYSGATR